MTSANTFSNEDILDSESRIDRKFDETERLIDGQLDATGKKNIKHAEEIHDEIEATRAVMAKFLARQLPEIDPDNWWDVCIERAFREHVERNPMTFIPSHTSLADYDIRALCVILAYNFRSLVFERGEQARYGDVFELTRIRNAYEHRTRELNKRNWRLDQEFLQSFRSKMQTDADIEHESYGLDDLAGMELDVADYRVELDLLEHRVEALGQGVLGMSEQVRQHANNDQAQFDELHKQSETDRVHTESIGENASRISWLTTRDRIQRIEIIGLSGLSLASLAVALVSLLKK